MDAVVKYFIEFHGVVFYGILRFAKNRDLRVNNPLS